MPGLVRGFSFWLLRIVAFALAFATAAQQIPAGELVRTAIVEDTPVVLMPVDAADFSGISTGDGRRAYRVTHDGRTYTAHAAPSAAPLRFAFDPANRRFRAISATIRVELDDYGDLDAIAREQGAVLGKAYPQLGFALLRLDAASDAAAVVESLARDPRVQGAHLQFEQPRNRPNAGSRRLGAGLVTGPSQADDEGSLLSLSSTADLFDPDFAIVDVEVVNSGTDPSAPATLQVATVMILPDGTVDDGEPEFTEEAPVHALAVATGDRFRWRVSIPLAGLTPERTYLVELTLRDGSPPVEDAEPLAREFATGFTLDESNWIRHTCVEAGRETLAGLPDPLQTQQWSLSNTGQDWDTGEPGVSWADMGMESVLRHGPAGAGVRVAVVDEGLEICHPDLRDNVEPGASFNFTAERVESARPLGSILAQAIGVDVTDPFYAEPLGDHGTSVAGVIASVANNGVGVRGVAPKARLRGYNYLREPSFFNQLDSLGASGFNPNSTDVDIFNMSYGTDCDVGCPPTNASYTDERLFAHGTRTLRSGLGAAYVKAAGNDFNECGVVDREDMAEILGEVGCISSTSDPSQNLPYLVVAGAFNAAGKRASYSSAGPNLWVTAPGGETGVLTVDQMGLDRGYDLAERWGDWWHEHGDYVPLNGTSAAAPNVSGAVTVLLEAFPDLTWRDVKYVLAKSALPIDLTIEPYRFAIGGSDRVLRHRWIVNAAGYPFHNWYGFGALDLDEALLVAAGHAPDSLGAFRQSGWFETGTDFGPVDIPDFDADGVEQQLYVGGLPPEANIEAVVLELSVKHEISLDQLGVDLVSPSGTPSVVNQVFNRMLAGETAAYRWRILSNAFYGENPNGYWRINVFDAEEGGIGGLDGWRLRFHYGDHPVP